MNIDSLVVYNPNYDMDINRKHFDSCPIQKSDKHNRNIKASSLPGNIINCCCCCYCMSEIKGKLKLETKM